MVACPRCGKSYKDQTRLLQHMNQPVSSCLAHYEEVLRINEQIAALKTPSSRREGLNITQNLTPNSSSPPLSPPHLPPSPPLMAEGHPMDIDQLPENLHYFQEIYPQAAQTFGKGATFMDQFYQDIHSAERKSQPYYPFASRDEWEMASFLLKSNLSMNAIDKFLKLKLIQNLGLSFRTAKDLRNRAEMLPAGPAWKCIPIQTVYPTKNKILLYCRNPVECIQAILRNPLLGDHIDFAPFELFETAEKLMRIYTEWLSGDAAKSMQAALPVGATLLGTILSSDKTNISAQTGNRVAHPLLISLANIKMAFRNKALNHLFLLLALLPIPRFTHAKRKMRGVLESRLFHECLDIILAPVKTAAQIGIMMSDPLGYKRFCFTPIAAYIVDTPESALISGVAGKTSSVTMAFYKQFGDNFQHPPRTASTTIAQLMAIESTIHPWDLDAYIRRAMEFRLSGVHRPFWRDYPLSDPSVFLTPEPLHHWHKQFWDHDVKWCINAVGAAELDFRFAVLHPHTGFRQFREGISSLKQVTGREHRDVERYIVSVIAGAVSPNFLKAIRFLLDFRYLAQAPEIDETTCLLIEEALKGFHTYKQAILDAKARRGKGSSTINNWYIPKLEFLQSVVANLRLNGVPIQWSADSTEHAHIEVVKDPGRSGNNQGYESQICRSLDRSDKLRNFDLATAVNEANLDFRAFFDCPSPEEENNEDDEVDVFRTVSTTAELLADIDTVSQQGHTGRNIVDYFFIASQLKKGLIPSSPRPYRTHQSSPNVAFHLTRDPTYKTMSVTDAAAKFGIPDLKAALGDYLMRIAGKPGTPHINIIGGRRLSSEECELPFNGVQVWNRVRLQSKAYHAPYNRLDPHTINSYPISPAWPLGHYDSAIINLDPVQEWPLSGIHGHVVADVRLIFRIVLDKSRPQPASDFFLTYVQRFDIVPHLKPQPPSSRSVPSSRGAYPEPNSSLYILKRGRRSNTSRSLIGDVIPLHQIRALVDLIPCFGQAANRSLTQQNSTVYSTEYFLNKYFDKELFWALNSSTSNQ